MKGAAEGFMVMDTASGIKNAERRAEGQTLRSNSSLFSGIPAEQGSSARPN